MGEDPHVRIACVGGGPAGLYLGILAARSGAHEVTVYDRVPEGRTHGWGVVFWDDLLQDLYEHDGPSAAEIHERAFRWTDQVIDVQGREPVRIPSSGYSMRRQIMMSILARRARELGVGVHHGVEIGDVSDLGTVDLVVASDGVNSGLRRRNPDGFGTTVERGRNRYAWLGTSRVFDSFTFPFVLTEGGWIWAHAYGLDDRTSTFIVETSHETWTRLGFDALGREATMHALGRLFASQLDGHELRPQAGSGARSLWLNFPTVRNRRWHHGCTVLVGDAAHTAHFSVGSGTQLALQDAMALADALAEDEDLQLAMESYVRCRRGAVRQVQREAGTSARWFESLPRYMGHDGGRFADLLIARRSPLLPYLPPTAYLRAVDVASTMPLLAGWGRTIIQRVSRLVG